MEDLIKLASIFEEKIGNYTDKTPARTAIANNILLTSEKRSAIALIMALRNIYGTSFLHWEPETLWLSLEKENVVLSELSRDKIQAAITLFINPAFFWDNLVFQRTVQALNEVPYNPEALQECSVSGMCWAVYEATLLRTLDPEDKVVPEFDEDVQQYVATCLLRAGYVYPPNQLKFAYENLLSMMPKEGKDKAVNIKNSWEHIPKDTLLDRKFTEDVLGIQLSKLAACYLYVHENTSEMAKDVLDLEQAIIP